MAYCDPPYEIHRKRLYANPGRFDHDRFHKVVSNASCRLLISYNAEFKSLFQGWQLCQLWDYSYSMRSTPDYRASQQKRQELLVANFENQPGRSIVVPRPRQAARPSETGSAWTAQNTQVGAWFQAGRRQSERGSTLGRATPPGRVNDNYWRPFVGKGATAAIPSFARRRAARLSSEAGAVRGMSSRPALHPRAGAADAVYVPRSVLARVPAQSSRAIPLIKQSGPRSWRRGATCGSQAVRACVPEPPGHRATEPKIARASTAPRRRASVAR